MKPLLTEAIARSASMDAANRSMRKAGRTAWNEDDRNVACAEYERLWPAESPTAPADEAMGPARSACTQ